MGGFTTSAPARRTPPPLAGSSSLDLGLAEDVILAAERQWRRRRRRRRPGGQEMPLALVLRTYEAVLAVRGLQPHADTRLYRWLIELKLRPEATWREKLAGGVATLAARGRGEQRGWGEQRPCGAVRARPPPAHPPPAETRPDTRLWLAWRDWRGWVRVRRDARAAGRAAPATGVAVRSRGGAWASAIGSRPVRPSPQLWAAWRGWRGWLRLRKAQHGSRAQARAPVPEARLPDGGLGQEIDVERRMVPMAAMSSSWAVTPRRGVEERVQARHLLRWAWHRWRGGVAVQGQHVVERQSQSPPLATPVAASAAAPATSMPPPAAEVAVRPAVARTAPVQIEDTASLAPGDPADSRRQIAVRSAGASPDRPPDGLAGDVQDDPSTDAAWTSVHARIRQMGRRTFARRAVQL